MARLAPSLPGQGGLVAEIHLHEGETLESALRRFKRKVTQKTSSKRLSGTHSI
jgi:hypothetical protein